ncbi:hypothetical protein PsorP6_014022 [Peronosclerospora sorghi]|uniref:Uncharacterized protein n=1 Tax=Peronosclerospora sorghi TaxID=230839 RepID=A0ACC0VGD6_9STRA|nr:hypothetical protein PsorP6_014022 [Peronosclerospora sorghi]
MARSVPHSLESDALEPQPEKPPVQAEATPLATGPNQPTQEPPSMAKTKRRMFVTPSLRISATASSAAAASAANKIKSNLSSVTKLPTALKRPMPNSTSATHEDKKVPVDVAPTTCSSPTSLSRIDSSREHEETKAAAPRMFGIPSLMRLKTVSKEHTAVEGTSDDSPHGHSTSDKCHTVDMDHNAGETSGNESLPEHPVSAVNSASRFVRGMPTMLKRAVTPDGSVTRKKSPDKSASSTLQEETGGDDPENDRLSLLLMLQVPQARRQSQVPLMAASETW